MLCLCIFIHTCITVCYVQITGLLNKLGVVRIGKKLAHIDIIGTVFRLIYINTVNLVLITLILCSFGFKLQSPLNTSSILESIS
jgi:hypothetical protein